MQLIMLVGIKTTDVSLTSPVYKLTVDTHNMSCYLNAHKLHAVSLTHNTHLLFRTLSEWAGDDDTLVCQVSSVQTLTQLLDTQSTGSHDPQDSFSPTPIGQADPLRA